jgi:hypothetical protein
MWYETKLGQVISGILIAYAVIAHIEVIFFHHRYKGPMKRGLKVWSERLPSEIVDFLRCLPADIVDDKTGGFMRKEQDAVLISSSKWRWFYPRRRMMYVGYVKLNAIDPSIEFRVPVSIYPFPIVWMAIIIAIGFIAPTAWAFAIVGAVIFYLLHKYQRAHILRFICKQMQKSVSASDSAVGTTSLK